MSKHRSLYQQVARIKVSKVIVTCLYNAMSVPGLAGDERQLFISTAFLIELGVQEIVEKCSPVGPDQTERGGKMYRPYYNRQFHQQQYSNSPYPDNEIYDAQRRISFLFRKRTSARVEGILGKHNSSTRSWSPYDRWENHALPDLLPSSPNITRTIYPDPSPDYNIISRRLSEEKNQTNEVVVYPDVVSDSAQRGNTRKWKNSASDPGNDSGFGSISDTPTCSTNFRTGNLIPLNCEEKPEFKLNLNALDNKQGSHAKSNMILISDDDNSVIAVSDENSVIAVSDENDDDEESIIGQFFSREEATTSEKEPNVGISTDRAREPEKQMLPDEPVSKVKSQKHFFKCDYCDFKALSTAIMRNHFCNSGHTCGAEIMGYQDNETLHCKSIIDPVGVHLVLKKRSPGILTNLVIMCPICFKFFPSMYQCANHAKRDHNENVYGIGNVRGHHTIYVGIGLTCLCNKQFHHVSEIEQHVHKCQKYQVRETANMANIFVCPFCLRMFDRVAGCHSHIQSEATKREVRDNVQVKVLHVSHPANKKPMLPYACGPTLQDVSEDRVIYPNNKKKAMKAWRKNKSQVLNAYHNGPKKH